MWRSGVAALERGASSAAARIHVLGNLLAGAGLADHEIPVGLLDDLVDVRCVVPGENDEAVRLGPDVLVLLDRHRDPLVAGLVAALADELREGGVHRDVLDALVDLAEEALI